MKVLLACDKFKGSLTGREVNEALATGILLAHPGAEITTLPVADGGDGTLEAAFQSGFVRHDVVVPGPAGAGRVHTAYARRGDTAVVELADSAGLLHLSDELAPLHATTYGTGLVLREAVEAGCTRVVLGVGGSASTDGGAGLLTALGARIFDVGGEPVPPGGVGLADVASVDLTVATELMHGVSVVVATDVDNPLLGANGAAAVYAPQKGASSSEVQLLESALQRWADVLEVAVGRTHRDDSGAGAAGGTGFGALAALGATCASGIDTVLDLVEATSHLRDVDLVVTGEGSLDEQTLRGKAPVGVARLAQDTGVPVVAVCGRNRLDHEQVRAAGFSNVVALSSLEPDPGRSMAQATQLLIRVGRGLVPVGTRRASWDSNAFEAAVQTGWRPGR